MDASSHLNLKGGINITEEIQRKAASPVVNDFLIAARRGLTTGVLLALKEGGAAATDKHGRNCLQLAASHGHFDTVSSILQTSLIDIDAVNKRGLTALHDACNEGYIKIALLLIVMGASVTSKTKDGWTCLMSACCNGHLHLAKILVAIGCDITVQAKLGLTALHIAAWKGHTALVEMLLHEGCNPQTASQNGKTALQMAQEENQHQCVTVLRAAISKISEEPRYKISSLEGQLRVCQNRLSETHRNYDVEITKQKLQSGEKLASLQADHEAEMDKTKKRIEKLESILREAELLSVTLSKESNDPSSPLSPPPLCVKSPGKRRKWTKKTDPPSNTELINAMTSSPSNLSASRGSHLELSDRPKSASYRDLRLNRDDSTISTNGLPTTPQLSPANTKENFDKKLLRNDSSNHLTITALIAESLSNPSSISAIRKELKSDSFTPKIQKKFHKRPLATSIVLPSMSLTNNE